MSEAPFGNATIIRREHHPLFGFYHAPVREARNTAVVICAPLGYEGLVSYRTCRHLAEHLSQQGFHVLRFDYFGTGNSSGDSTAAHNLCADVRAAVDHIKQLADVPRVCLLGIRAGALLASAAAVGRDDISSLILIAAPNSGRAMMRELKAFQAMSVSAPLSHTKTADAGQAEAGLNVVGFEYPQPMQQELEQINLLKTDFSTMKNALLLAADDAPDDSKLLNHLSQSGCRVMQTRVEGYAAMMMTTTEGSILPVATINQVQDWLITIEPAHSSTSQSSTHHKSIHNQQLICNLDEVTLVEAAVRFGPAKRLFGILSQPAKATHPETHRERRRAVLLLSVGANHHIGSGRVYVTIARELAATGLFALRFDVSGLGESRAELGKNENVIYDPDSIRDVGYAMDFLTAEFQIEEFILTGVCFGAHIAFHATAANKPIVGRLLVNWAVFDMQPPVHTRIEQQKSFKSIHYYWVSTFKPDTWRRLLRGDVASGAIAGHVFKYTGRLLLAAGKRALSILGAAKAGANSVETKMKGILHSGTPTWLVYSAGDPALDGLQLYLGYHAAWVNHYTNFSTRVVEDADHAFSRPSAQRALRTLMLEFTAKISS